MQRFFQIFLFVYFILSFFEKASSEELDIYYRFKHSISHLQVSPNHENLAYINADDQTLNVFSLKNRKNTHVLGYLNTDRFFWSPLSSRLFYKVNLRSSMQAKVYSYDLRSKKSKTIKNFKLATSPLTFNLNAQEFLLFKENSIVGIKLKFPNNRLSKWHKIQTRNSGRWLVNKSQVFWVSNLNNLAKRVDINSNKIKSYTISPDGKYIVWEDSLHQLFLSKHGEIARLIDHGRDPEWHPRNRTLVYSSGRFIGKVATSWDLKVLLEDGSKYWLTNTRSSDERFPQWLLGKQTYILYTKRKTTDLFSLVFKENKI